MQTTDANMLWSITHTDTPAGSVCVGGGLSDSPRWRWGFLGEPDMESGLVWLPSARRQFSDPCSHSTETSSLAGTVETDGCLDNEQTHMHWLVLQ